jgi:nucleotide-binding universal stress UspA family protein
MTKPAKHEVIGRVQRSYPRLHRILVPLDFSGKSRAALRHAVPLADKFGGKIVLLHVLGGGTDKDAPPLGSTSSRRAAALKRLRETALQFMPAEMLDDALVRSGKPSVEIVEAARALRVDLIAITTQGSTGLKRLLMGSTADEVLRLAECPVLTVRKK